MGWLIFVILILVAAWIRIVIGLGDYLWLDELHTSWVVDGNLSDVAHRARIGNQSPFYFWLVWPIVSTFGQSALSLRILSLLFGLATILAASWVTKKWTNNWLTVNFVALWMALDPTFVFYSTEARPYVLLQLLSVIQIYCFTEWVTHSASVIEPGQSTMEPKKNATSRLRFGIGFLSTSVLIFYFHYTGVLILVAELVFVACNYLFLRPNSEIRQLKLQESVTYSGVFLVLISPGLYHLLGVFGRRQLWNSVSDGQDLLIHFMMPIGIGMVLPLVGFCLLFMAFRLQEHDTSSLRVKTEQLILVGLWIAAPVSTAYLLDAFSIAPIALPRYCVIATAGIPLFAGLLISKLQGVLGRLILTFILAIVFVGLNPIVRQSNWEAGLPRTRFEDWSILEQIQVTEPGCQNVFVFANILEDQLALTNHENRFLEYLKFPVAGIYKKHLAGMEIHMGNTLGPTHFSKDMIEPLNELESRPAVIVVRGTQSLINEIVTELQRRCPTPLAFRQFGSSNLDVQLIFINRRQ